MVSQAKFRIIAGSLNEKSKQNTYFVEMSVLYSFLNIQKIYNPELASAEKTRAVKPNMIELGSSAFVSEEELANTIAHELNHARSFLKGRGAP